MIIITYVSRLRSGADPGFQVRVGALFGVFRLKNHDFTPKNLIFFQFWGGGGAPDVSPYESFSSSYIYLAWCLGMLWA